MTDDLLKDARALASYLATLPLPLPLNADLIRRLVARVEELERELDPPVCRLQFPDGSVPGNAREAAEGWKRWADEFQRRERPLAWSDAKPTVPGNYWYRRGPGEESNLVFCLLPWFGERLLADTDGQFAGPIPPPGLEAKESG